MQGVQYDAQTAQLQLRYHAGQFMLHMMQAFHCMKKEEEEEEGLQGVFKRLRRNGHQLEKGLQMAQRGPSLKCMKKIVDSISYSYGTTALLSTS
jgi:hypothetical protein